jgi:DNA polymerase-3 subunit delta
VRATRTNIDRLVDQPPPDVRFYLFYGPDEAQSRALAQRLQTSLAASRELLVAGALKDEPGALLHAANERSLFGGARLLWIEPAGEAIAEAAEALIAASEVESATVAIAGALPKSSKLLKLAEASPAACAYVSYVPEGPEAARMVSDLGRRFGLKVSAPVAARLADMCANDQAIATRELEKLALYVDASPHTPKELPDEAIDAVGVDSSEGAFLRVADMALSGDIGSLAEELSHLPPGNSEAIVIVRSLQRRLLALAPARARVERGERPDAVMTAMGKALFWKDKPAFGRMLQKWSADDLATVAERAGRLERDIMLSPAPAVEALGEELFAIARKARSL